MPLFTVVIPTHSHVATLSWAIKSVLEQTLQDFELIVVGDGAPEATGSIMAEWCGRDPRIHYRPNVKGAGYGELYRHQALQQARGSLVAYLGDDDLWLPHHLEMLAEPLRHFDLAHTPMTTVSTTGQILVTAGRLDTGYARACLLKLGLHSCGPTSVGHTMEAYRKLPFGWRPKPENKKSDTHMWQQWLSQDWVRVGYVLRVTTLHIGSPPRLAMSDEQRGEESGKWYERSRAPGFEGQVLHHTLSRWQSLVFHRKHEQELLDSLVSGQTPSPESIAVLAAQFGDRAGGNFPRFMLQKALMAQENLQWQVAEQLYSIVEGRTLDTPSILLQAKYKINAGDYSVADHLLASIASNDTDIVGQIANLREICRSMLLENRD